MNILITGCNGLIGKTIVKHFSSIDGFKVFGMDVDEKPKIESKNFNYYRSNVSSFNDVKEVFNDLKSKNYTISGLINSHQFKPKGFLNADLFNMELGMWKEIIDVNLTGTFYTCRIFGEKMKEVGVGSIINFASTYAVVSSNPSLYNDNSMGNPIAYSASKGGVISLTQYLACYLGEFGVRSNCITPHGVINNHEEEFISNFSSRSPLKRMMKPEEIIGPVELLLTNKGSYINGSNLMVDGGWTVW